MKRAPLLLSCAIVAATTTGYAADVQNEDFIFESFMFEQLRPVGSDGERILVESPEEGAVVLAVFSLEGQSGNDWAPDSIIKIPPFEPGSDSWLEKAELSGDHAALLLWDDDQGTSSLRLFHATEDQWFQAYEIHDGGPLGAGFRVTGSALQDNQLFVALANEDETDPVAGAIMAFRYENGAWWHETELELDLPEEPSVDLGSGNWMRYPSSYSIQINGDTMVVTENAVFVQDITFTWLSYPIVHTFHQDGNGDWSLDHTMRFQPGCAAEMMMDEGSVWVDLDFQDDRMVLLRHEECTSQDYPWQTSEAVREYNWNDGLMKWTMASNPFGIPAAGEVIMLDANRVLLRPWDQGVHEFRLESGSWSHVVTHEPGDPELLIDSMISTDSVLYVTTYLDDNDFESGPVLGFEFDNGGNNADIDGDGTVGVNDVLALIAEWGETTGAADINGDGIVDVNDLLELLQAYDV